MKKVLMMVLVGALVLTPLGCSQVKENEATAERAVELVEVKSEERPEIKTYIGTVNAKDSVKYSFKTPGKIAAIPVSVGQVIHKGDVLAQMDPQELRFQSEGSSSTLQAAEATVRQAEEALAFDEAYRSKMETLLKAQGISKIEYDQAVLKATVSKENLNQALKQVDALKSDSSYKDYLLKNATLRADADGVVAEKLNEVGEQVDAYYPVVVVRSGKQIVNVGIPQQDLSRFKLGSGADIELNGKSVSGKLTNLSQIPDVETRTYKAEVSLDEGAFNLGEIVRVHFSLGVSEGIWIPMTCVLSEGESYVYIIEKDRVFRKVIEVQEVRENSLRVSGLEDGQKIVIAGMRNLSDGMLVKVASTAELEKK